MAAILDYATKVTRVTRVHQAALPGASSGDFVQEGRKSRLSKTFPAPTWRPVPFPLHNQLPQACSRPDGKIVHMQMRKRIYVGE